MIGWLHPWALLGLGAALVPLLLHLVTRRDPPVVIFPAVRYLVAATREHQRRLRLRHWLLLLIRTLLIAALVTAAAGPSLPGGGAGRSHGPTAMVLLVDNSLSSGAVVGGTGVLSLLQRAGHQVLDQATPEDRLWLVTADGIPRAGSRGTLALQLDSLEPSDRRLDLGEAIRSAAALLSADQHPGQIVVLTDLQRSALSPASVSVPLLIVHPDEPAPSNVGIAGADPGPLPWTGETGHVRVILTGDSGQPRPVTAQLGGRPPRQLLLTPGVPGDVPLATGGPGWSLLTLRLDPDELRADDVRELAVRVARPAKANCAADQKYLVIACAALASGGRIASGGDVSLGSLGSGASVVPPPADPALLGALNRSLDARGAGWRFGVLTTVATTSDSGTWLGRTEIARRYTLIPSGSGRTGVMATAGHQPWLVRGNGVVLIGSRLEPEWTHLPLEAGFIPLVDAMANRLAQKPVWLLDGAPGRAVLLPDPVTRIVRGAESWPVEGGAAFQPPRLGVYFMLAGTDTVGALTANPDPRESDLRPASDAEVRSVWPRAMLTGLDGAGPRAFAGAGRTDMRGALLWLAFCCALAEVGLASLRRSAA